MDTDPTPENDHEDPGSGVTVTEPVGTVNDQQTSEVVPSGDSNVSEFLEDATGQENSHSTKSDIQEDPVDSDKAADDMELTPDDGDINVSQK